MNGGRQTRQALPVLRPTCHVHVADADAGFRHSVVVALEAGGFEVSAGGDVSGLKQRLTDTHIHATLVNVSLLDAGWQKFVMWLRATKVSASVFLITDQRPDAGWVAAALEQGTDGIFHHRSDPGDVVEAVRSVRPRPDWIGVQSMPGLEALTEREREVLMLVASGSTSKEAGRLLGISPRTVEVHRARCMSKLGARNTADLVRMVFNS